MQPQLDLEKCAEMLARCTCLRLRKATRVVTQRFDETLRQGGLRSTQLPVLVTLALAGSTTIMLVAEELVMDRTTLTRVLKPLEIEGLIRISPGKDRRTREVSLTDRGREAVAKAMPLWDKLQAQVTDGLGPQWLDSLHSTLLAVESLASQK